MSLIFVGVEDELSASTARAILRSVFGDGVEMKRLHANRAGGFGQIQINISKYTKLAANQCVLLITDLDQWNCPLTLISNWFGEVKIPDRMSFRVAVREIEAWIMADSDNFAEFLGVPNYAIPSNLDTLVDPKKVLVSLARKGRKEIRAEIVPSKGSNSPQGLGYNDALSGFVNEKWDAAGAGKRCDSLRRTLVDLKKLQHHLI